MEPPSGSGITESISHCFEGVKGFESGGGRRRASPNELHGTECVLDEQAVGDQVPQRVGELCVTLYRLDSAGDGFDLQRLLGDRYVHQTRDRVEAARPRFQSL